jgi:hypothetical protein
MFMDIPSPFPYKATVGIDWADQKHDVFVRFAKGDSYRRKIDSRPEAIQEWLLELRSACAEGKIAIALEQRRGALFYQLCTHLNWIDLYPVNPHSLASFRLTFFSSRAKDDPIDSQLLEELVRTHSERLRPYQPESTTERKLDQYCRHRRSLLDLATKTELKLISTLKQYFPLAVNHFAAVGMKSDMALNFLSRWPTLDELQRAKTHTVRSFFYAHNSRSQTLIEKRLQQVQPRGSLRTFSKGQILFVDATRGSPSSRQSRTLTDSGSFRSSPEIQPAINTHRSRSGPRFCPIDF